MFMHKVTQSLTRQQEAPITTGKTIRWAHHYDFVVKLLTFGRQDALRQQTIRYASIPNGATVLDVGCGTGTLTLLAKAGAGKQGKVYGIDASPEMIHVAQQKALQRQSQVDFQTGLIESLPFSDATFDIVLSSLMFHHLPSALKQRGLAEIYRVLKPGGRLLIVDMQKPTTHIQRFALAVLVHHGMMGDVRDVRPLMEKLGYVNTQTGTMSWSVVGFAQGSRPQ
jgi:demethylmenaquinone methyltransferase/2-methoxy-6-polyprenyl-1,4-benzoquinol methylase/phosphoethanolamine N-methyltransferase